MKKGKRSIDPILRQRALELLKMKPLEPRSQLSEADILKLIHELEVHQIELELQNEELKLAKEREAELATEKYIELYDFAPSGYFTLSREGVIIDLNLSGAKMLGKERSYIENNRFGFFVTNDTKPILNQFLDKVFNSKSNETCELTLSSPENFRRYIHMAGIVSENTGYCFVTVLDITELKRAEQELIAAKDKAEESDRLKSAFLANVSHEIRTPMNGILGFADLLKDPDITDENKRRYIYIIEQSGARMLNIINDILDISKIEAGQMEVHISTTNINEQIESVYTFFKPEVEQKGIQIFFKNSLPEKKAIIKTDQEKVYAILINLVKNAIKFTKTGYIEFGYEKNGNLLQFFVKDTGDGIHQEQLKMIFERFRQGSDLLTRNYEGAGLGLFISMAYVEMLGGKMWVESEPGKGSVFYFIIPYNPIPEDKKVSESLITANVEVIPENKLKILIVEDDEFSEQLITIAVHLFCDDFLKARTGVDAVNACRNNPELDLVLMDVKLPEMDGYEATRQIRKFNKDVIIIAQTALGLVGEREKALASGCNDYVSKPLDLALLTSLTHIAAIRP